MPGRGRRTAKEEAVKQAGEEREKVRKRTASRREVDLESWIERNVDEVVSRAGLDYLGLDREVWLEVLRDLLAELYGSTSSYKSAEDVAKRFVRSSDRVLPVVAARLAQLLEKPSEDLLEFIVTNIGDAVLDLAPKIYSWIVKLKREDLLGTLKYKWGTAWTRNRTPMLPVACPRCGFNSLMPDLACLVCGASVSERELKESMDFSGRLRELLSQTDCSELGSMVKYDYVLVNNIEVKPPTRGRLPIDVEVYLSEAERGLVREEYKSRCANEAVK